MLLGSFCHLTYFSIWVLCVLCFLYVLSVFIVLYLFHIDFGLVPDSSNCNVVYYEVLLKVSNPAEWLAVVWERKRGGTRPILATWLLHTFVNQSAFNIRPMWHIDHLIMLVFLLFFCYTSQNISELGNYLLAQAFVAIATSSGACKCKINHQNKRVNCCLCRALVGW